MNIHFKNLVKSIKPDLIIFGHAELILEETFEYIKNKNIKMIYWYHDVPIIKNFQYLAPYFKLILTTAGGEFIDELKKYNQNTFFFPNLVNENIERSKAYNNDSFQFDLLFSGRKAPERNELIKFLDKNLKEETKRKFIGQNKKSIITGKDYFSIIANSKICINHNRDFTLKYKWYTSDRLMHIMGNGSFPLSSRIIDGEDFFEDKLDYYDSLDELVSKIDYFLENDKQRIKNSIWLRNRTHELFNSKRVTKYIIDLFEENQKKLLNYEWYK